MSQDHKDQNFDAGVCTPTSTPGGLDPVGDESAVAAVAVQQPIASEEVQEQASAEPAEAVEHETDVDHASAIAGHGPRERLMASSSPLTLATALALAGALTRGDYDALEKLVGECVDADLTPGQMRMVAEEISEATKWSSATVNAVIDDRRAHRDGHGVLSSKAKIARAYKEELCRRYDGVAWADGRLYTYRSSKHVMAENDPPEELDHWSATPVDVEDEVLLDFVEGMPAAKSAGARREIRDIVRTLMAEPGKFDNARPGVNVANGFVEWDFQSGRLMLHPHSPSHLARAKLGVTYTCEADAPVFKRGLERVLPHTSRRLAAQEISAAVLFGLRAPRDSERGAALLHGAARTGKTSIIEVLKSFFPPDLIASVPPAAWSDAYSRAQLAGKVLNTATELAGNKLVASETFKTIVGGEPFQARHPYERPFQTRFNGFHLFACNALPSTDDKSQGLARRLTVVGFEHPLDLDEVDGEFLATVRRDELAGVLNWAAEAVPGLLERGYFALPDGHAEGVLQMQYPDDHVAYAAAFGVEKVPGGRLYTAEAKALLREVHRRRGLAAGEVDGAGDMRRFAGFVREMHGAERSATNRDPFYKGVRVAPAYAEAVEQAVNGRRGGAGDLEGM